MSDVQTLYYSGQKLRTIQIEDSHWWAIHDVSRIIKLVRYEKFKDKLSDEEKKIVVVKNSNGRGGSRLTFINKSALYAFLNRSYRHEAVEFQHWLESEIGVNFSDIQEQNKKSLSVAANLQKAQMLIRIAENKATPYNEQIRLLDMAVRELTGTGFNLDMTINAKPIDIMELPEVVGFIHKKETKLVDGVKVNYITADMMAKKWRTFFDNTFDGKAFSEIANEFGYKNPKFGYWQRVMTPDGEAREFMYFDGTVLDYINKKFSRVA